MLFEPWKTFYNCKNGCSCDEFVEIKIDCICNGLQSCDLCGGEGKFDVLECPKKQEANYYIESLFTPFFIWRTNGRNAYPDGGAYIMQPSILIDAFLILDSVFTRKEQEAKA
jgi:hypothetical protein